MITKHCECGRKISMSLNPVRNPGSGRHARRGALKDHELCRQCYQALMTAVHQQERPAR